MSKRKRRVDLSVHPSAHLGSVLRSPAGSEPKSQLPWFKRLGHAAGGFGRALRSPFVKTKRMVDTGLHNTQQRLNHEDEARAARPLPYYDPQVKLVGAQAGQVVLPLQGPLPRRPRQTMAGERAKKPAKKNKQLREVVPGEPSQAPPTLPKQKKGVKLRAFWQRRKKVLIGGGLAIALLAVFGWYMLEGRYCVVAVFDNGYYQAVRTKESSVEAMLQVAGITLTPEDALSVGLNRKPEKGLSVDIVRARTIDVHWDGQSAQVRMANATVRDVFKQLNILLGEYDQTSMDLDLLVQQDASITVLRAMNIAVATKSQTYELNLTEGTVGDALTAAGITWDGQDNISPAASTPLAPGMRIAFSSVEYKTQTRTETIAFKTIKKNSSAVNRGSTKVDRAGKNGEKKIVEQVRYEDGKEVSRTVVSTTVVSKAVDQITLVGTRIPINPAIDGLPKGGPKASMIARTLVIDQITAYTHSGRKTATGKWPMVGMCAVDRNLIPYGTKLYIPGYGYAVAEDTGSGGGSLTSIDVFMDSQSACLRWGRKRNVKVYILK